MNDENIERGQKIISELISIVQELSDEDIGQLFQYSLIDPLLLSIRNPSREKDYLNMAEFFLDNKHRLKTLSYIRMAIQQHINFQGEKDGHVGYVSPHFEQWFDDGVLYIEGTKPFEGVLVYYNGKEAKYAIAARDVRKGERMGREHFQFINMEDFLASLEKLSSKQITNIDEPINQLKSLLSQEVNDESKYHSFFEEFPWVLGLQYLKIQDLRYFDDENIPDFTGIRAHDSNRDVIEIKPPFTSLFRKNGKFNSEFNKNWNQAERYLDFSRTENDYLRRKGLNFDNPRCYLISGYDLSQDQLKKIRRKERLNPAIQFLTYNDLLAFIENTIARIKRLK